MVKTWAPIPIGLKRNLLQERQPLTLKHGLNSPPYYSSIRLLFSLRTRSAIMPECFPFPTPLQMQSPNPWGMGNTQAPVIS